MSERGKGTCHLVSCHTSYARLGSVAPLKLRQGFGSLGSDLTRDRCTSIMTRNVLRLVYVLAGNSFVLCTDFMCNMSYRGVK